MRNPSPPNPLPTDTKQGIIPSTDTRTDAERLANLLRANEEYHQLMIRLLSAQVNYHRRALGQNPKRCPHCAGELK